MRIDFKRALSKCMKYAVLLLTALMVDVSAGCAATNDDFRCIRLNLGMVSSQVNSIVRDSRGYVWFATQSGLCRYDGYRLTVFANDRNNKHSLPNDNVESVQEANDCKLWIKTSLGYCTFDALTEDFSPLEPDHFKRYGVAGTPDVIYIDAEKNMWLAVPGKGVYCIHAGSMATTFLQLGKKLHNANVTSISCRDGKVVISFIDGYVMVVDASTSKVLWQSDFISRTRKTPTTGYKTYMAADMSVSVITDNQSYVYSKSRGKWYMSWREYFADNGFNIPFAGDMLVKDIVFGSNGILWIATEHKGLIKVDNKTRTVSRYVYEKDNPNSLPDNTVQSLYIDSLGGMWIGCYKTGVAYYSPSWFKFTSVDIGDICTIAQDRNGLLWCGSNDDGIISYDLVTRRTTTYNQAATGLGSNTVVSSLAASDGTLWFGTYNGGMACLRDGRWKVFRAGDGSGLLSDNVWAFCELPDSRIAIGTLGAGVQILDLKNGTFVNYNQARSGLASDYINSMQVRHDGRLMVSHSNGYSIIDLKTGKISNVSGTRSGDDFLSPQINQILEDSRGLIWCATASGMNVYDPRTDKLSTVLSLAGIPHSPACSVIEDRQHNIWVVTGRNVAKIEVKKDSNGGWTSYATVYNELDGLQDRAFNYRSILLAADGEIIVGGQSGLNIIPTRNAGNKANNARVLFSGLVLFDHPLRVGEEYNGRVVLKEDIDVSRELRLRHNDNTFSIQLASSEVTVPQNARFRYRLVGLSDKWIDTPENQNSITFTGLRPGCYTLEARVVARDGTVSPLTGKLRIVIAPPPYLSWWAWLLYIIIIGAVVAYGHRTMERRRKARMAVRQYQLEAQRTKEIDDMKLAFFTNVSHELRTPLMLIISPLQSLMKKETDAGRHHTLELIWRNAQRLLDMVNQILDFRRIESSKESLKLISGDIVSYVGNIVSSFQTLGGKKIELEFYTQVESLTMSFDADKVRKIVDNLLSNAFKYTPDGGKIVVSTSVRDDNGNSDGKSKFELRVADNGIGISDADKKHIFERFYVAHNATPNPYGGTGIGLSLVKEFALLHGGDVTVGDNVGGGTVFTVTIPISRDVAANSVGTGKDMAQDNANTADGNFGDMCLENEAAADGQTMTDVRSHSAVEAKAGIGAKPEVLLVDDSGDFIDFMSGELGGKYKVRTASNGKEALDKISEHQPDLIISDVMMPVMDGNELCRSVKKNKATAGIPFIMLTARLAQEQQMQGFESGADEYITKPFNLDMLYMRIDNLLKWHNSSANDSSGKIRPELKHVEITPLDKRLVDKATNYIDDNISDSSINVEAMAKAMGMSRVQLYKKLLSITGSTPTEFIRQIRLRRAEQLLRESQMSVSEVAYKVGFNNPRYFSKYFKEMYGVMPSQYKK